MSTDYSTGSKRVTIPLVGEASIEVSMLSPAGMVELAERIQDRRRDQLRDNLRDCGCDPKVMLQHLNTINTTPVRLGDIVFPIANDGWLQACVVDIALRGRVDAIVPPAAYPVVAAALLGLELISESEKREGDGPFPDSPTGQNPSESSTAKPDESEPSTE